MTPFAKAVKVIIELEGGSTLVRDSGGLTKYGISQRSYPHLNIEALRHSDAIMLYKQDYWDTVKADTLPHPLSMYMFDAAVNQGPGTAIKMLQKSLHIRADGMFGKKTRAAIDRIQVNVRGIEGTIATFMSHRAQRYMGTRHFDKYGHGWLRRLFLLQQMR